MSRTVGLEPPVCVFCGEFIVVHDGEKRSTDHIQHPLDAPDMSRKYNVYGGAGAGAEAGRVLMDVDNYDGGRRARSS